MNNLKNALARDGFKKYQKSKIEVSGFKKSSQWSDIDFMMQKVLTSLSRKLISIIHKITLNRPSDALSKGLLAMAN